MSPIQQRRPSAFLLYLSWWGVCLGVSKLLSTIPSFYSTILYKIVLFYEEKQNAKLNECNLSNYCVFLPFHQVKFVWNSQNTFAVSSASFVSVPYSMTR